jgi:hypothetical protein
MPMVDPELISDAASSALITLARKRSQPILVDVIPASSSFPVMFALGC